MNKISKSILTFAALVTFVTGCSEQPQPPSPDNILVTSVTLSKTELTLERDATYQLSVTVLPENATNPAVSWESSAPTKLIVDQEGNLEAKEPGDYTVTVSSTDGSNKSSTCSVSVNDYSVPPDPPIDDHVANYYKNIKDTDSGMVLLEKLKALNSEKRKSTVGYSSMGTSPAGLYKYTDYDPETVQYDGNGQPYGTTIISFYSGNKTASFNREHVWPKSHGGNVVEDDIHMPRPTIESENGSRGNSFYVENMKSGTDGWDPAAESFGVESYRGDSARIIFYCVLADSHNFPDDYLDEIKPEDVSHKSRLTLVDVDRHDTTNKNRDMLMGKLSDMLKWNETYPVLDRELRRNSGAEYLQGNRNPFIDHPEYACRIWGLYNDNTKQACGLA